MVLTTRSCDSGATLRAPGNLNFLFLSPLPPLLSLSSSLSLSLFLFLSSLLSPAIESLVKSLELSRGRNSMPHISSAGPCGWTPPVAAGPPAVLVSAPKPPSPSPAALVAAPA